MREGFPVTVAFPWLFYGFSVNFFISVIIVLFPAIYRLKHEVYR